MLCFYSHLSDHAFVFVSRSNLSKMAAANRILEMMLGIQFSGTCRYDKLLDQFIWNNEDHLAKSDADGDLFKYEDTDNEVMDNEELPMLLTKHWNDSVLTGSPEKKTRRAVADGRRSIVLFDAQA